MVAVNSTASPYAEGFVSALRRVVVAAVLTTWSSCGAALAAYCADPLKSAVTACWPAPRVAVVQVATPAVMEAAPHPGIGVPSAENCTVPSPGSGVTTAVKVSSSPYTDGLVLTSSDVDVSALSTVWTC